MCHRLYKSRYTHKNDLEKCAAKRSIASDTFSPQITPAEDISLPTAKRSSTAKVKYKFCCLLCCKERNTKGDRKFNLIATALRQKAIQRKAKELGDKEILSKLEGYGETTIDMVAADFYYHKSCLDNFYGQKTQKTNFYAR